MKHEQWTNKHDKSNMENKGTHMKHEMWEMKHEK